MRKRAVRDRHPSEVTRKENDKIHHRTQKSHSSIYCLNRLGRNIRPVLPLVSKVLAIVLLLFCLWKILPDLPAVHPRIIQINDRYILQPESIEEITYRTVEPLLQGEIGRYSRHQFDKGDCKAMHQWQDEYIPVCNPFHEIDMYDSTYLASGFWRNVWRMRDGDGSLAAIKTLAWNRNFTLFDQNNHMKDAIAYSVLQSSEFIPNIYGYCKWLGLLALIPLQLQQALFFSTVHHFKQPHQQARIQLYSISLMAALLKKCLKIKRRKWLKNGNRRTNYDTPGRWQKQCQTYTALEMFTILHAFHIPTSNLINTCGWMACSRSVYQRSIQPLAKKSAIVLIAILLL